MYRRTVDIYSYKIFIYGNDNSIRVLLDTSELVEDW